MTMRNILLFSLLILLGEHFSNGLESLDWLDGEGEGYESVIPIIHQSTERFRRNTEESNGLGNGIGDSSGEVPLLVIIKGYNNTFYLELFLVDDVIDNRLTFDNKTDESGIFNVSNCLFRGKVISEPQGVASFSLCGGSETMYGSWITPEGHFVLRPAGKESENGHRLRRLGGEPGEKGVSFCGTSSSNNIVEPEKTSIFVQNKIRRKRQAFQKVIETAVFADVALNQKFVKKYKNKPMKELSNYIMAILNEVQLVYNFDSMKTRIKIVMVKFENLKKGGDAPGTAAGNIDKYLDNFCRWQSKKNPKDDKTGHWDHAIMLTGLNLFKLNSNGKKSDKVLGQAWVNGMCIPIYSCTINEGDDFEAAFVISHEMGHNLGMAHDGDKNSCESNKFIMSPVTGAGKINWSTCSNTALQKFLQTDQVKKCLNNDAYPSAELDYTKNGLPGQRYPPSAQCKLAMGNKYDAYMPNQSPYNNICYELWCITGMVATTTHPALDGSNCAKGKVCRQGKCV